MKLPSFIKLGPRNSHDRGNAAFTITELMVTTGLFVMMMAGILYAYVFGLNLYQITKVKMGASDDARKAIIKLTDEIRSANKVKIGTGTLTTFTEVATNGTQIGNAIQIYATTNTSNYVRYFYDTNTTSTNFSKLVRSTNSSISELVIAHAISNSSPIFSSEDPWGHALTNNLNNRVIGLSLQFYQIEYPIVRIGPGYYYDFYQLRTRITRRTLY